MTIDGVMLHATPPENVSVEPVLIRPLWWRENLNFFLLALLILFLIRFYCIEFFLIPSQSMYPTLHGHPHSGDRILVNRTAYDLSCFQSHHIQRWDVIVFKFPLNTARNFVKRVVALPGEAVEIRASNIWIQHQIATKPKSVQDHLFFENGRKDLMPFLEFFYQNFQLTPSPKSFHSVAKEDNIVVSAQERVSAIYVPQNAYAYDKDTRIHLRFAPTSLSGSFQVTLGAGSSQASLIFEQERLQCVVSQNGSPVFSQEIPFKLAFKQNYFLEFSFVDSEISVRLNDQEMFPVYQVNSTSLEIESRLFQLDFFQMECKLQNIRVFYDIRYTKEMDHLADYQLQSNEYFVCGDNSVESDDSRNWRKLFLAVQHSGQTLLYEGSAEQSEKMWKEQDVVFLDTLGKKYHFQSSRVKVVEKKPFPGIPTPYILGKAWLIIWPPDRIQWIR